MLLDLLRPFSFLTITHPTRKPLIINWVVPIILAGLVTSIGLFTADKIDVFGSSGLISRLLGFVQSLPGFYIAALAAIATFNNKDMLKPMPGTPPIGTVVYNGYPERVPMNRRRFLSSMFAYLTVLSIGLTLLAVIYLTVAPTVKDVVSAVHCQILKSAAIYIYLVFVCQMVAVTLWGLYYLGDRLHTPDSLDSSPPDSQSAKIP
ncbi:MAG: hypothetical protein PBV86_13550 [Delftia lacustris]|jgi:hypothetical protein|uniref:hypothetical protein n=1 Tax=Delftia TaxID=80865 RepID=UPI0012AA71FC|nr:MULTISPECIES: hypothetical protein [Delftia]QFS65861.1 hypothetical protein GCS91_16795 [Delftia tsuruhatensis]WON87445.1 hypothetical protein OK021_22225 [Delftia sp. UGAL515B_04]